MLNVSKKVFWGIALSTALSLVSISGVADYTQHQQSTAFVNKMVSEHGFKAQDINVWLQQAERQERILELIARPAEKTKPWYEYREIFLGADRVKQGLEFWQQYQSELSKAEQQFGVPAHVIVAIIGVETRFGRYKGSYRVLDALATLGFDYPPRSKFFRSELEHFFLLSREQGFDPLNLKGSYAGAMGFGQFISSSYRNYAVDFDGDKVADIINNPVDAIGSVANYFKRHGWKTGQPVVAQAKLSSNTNRSLLSDKPKPQWPLAQLAQQGFSVAKAVPGSEGLIAAPFPLQQSDQEEVWLAFNNFYVITRYNHSRLYAMAVHQLSEEIEAAYQRSQKQMAAAL